MRFRLVVALFAVLSLAVHASPLPCDTPSPTTANGRSETTTSYPVTPTDDCCEPTTTHTPSLTPTEDCSEPTPTHTPTDDCSEPTITHTPSSTPTDDCYEPTTVPPTHTPTDDCSEPTAAPPTPTIAPMTTSRAITPSSTASVMHTNSMAPISLDDQSNGPFTDGVATYFYQNGNPGACGWYNSDNAIICAMDQSRFGTAGPGSPLCGRQVRITNMNNNSTVDVTIADDCPTCENEDSIDLSVGAFQSIEPDLSVGEFPIYWYYL